MGTDGTFLYNIPFFKQGNLKLKPHGVKSQITYFVTSIWILIRMVFLG